MFGARVADQLASCDKDRPMTSLRDILRRPGILTLPGVYDGISARVANSLGFPALYMTGYGAVASALGVPDAGLASVTEMLDRVRCTTAAIDVPFIADGDTGYGGLLNVDRTVAPMLPLAPRGSNSRTRRSRRNAATPSIAASFLTPTPCRRSAWR
jgi:2-methylisocitrate lyase-like PEP mutase family enzyme